MAEPAGWRGIDELAALVGHYGWLESRLFALTGAWASRQGLVVGRTEDALRVWCAATSRRHGDLAARWSARLPVRAGVDPGALVTAPSGQLAEAMDALEAGAELVGGVGVLVGTVLPWVDGVYAGHAASASSVSEAPVLEVLVEARRVVAGELQGGRALLRGVAASEVAPARTNMTVFDRVFGETCVFPAVHPS